ncbi:hypothetical protein AB1N83_014072, partial [Pleurotus pulmonarius]
AGPGLRHQFFDQTKILVYIPRSVSTEASASMFRITSTYLETMTPMRSNGRKMMVETMIEADMVGLAEGLELVSLGRFDLATR